MTITFILVAIILIANFFFYRFIRKYNLYVYGTALVVASISMLFETNIINSGYVGFSLFLVVMFMGVLDKSEVKKRLLGNRAELAIIASIFAGAHGIKFIIFALDFEFLFSAPLYFYIGFASLVVAFPLFLTSFIAIRKKLKGKTWKKLHKLSYLFYLLVALHLILIQNDRMLFYIILFSTYFALRIWTYFDVKAKKFVPKKVTSKQTLAVNK